MTEHARPGSLGVIHRWVPTLLLSGLVLFHGVANWIWLSKNLMTRGWDRIGSLINSLYYYDTLTPLNWQAVFKAMVQDEYRPPLFGFSMALMYKLFDLSSDVAVMVNIVYLVVLLVAAYGLGARLGGRRMGMLSAVLVSLLPLVFAMSRYSYFEFALAALTLLSIYLLLTSERFQNRRNSLLLGVALGLGALLKRTFPIFVVGALLVVILQAGLPRKFWSRLRGGLRAPRWRDVGLALGGGLLLAGLWCLPNWDTAQTLTGGVWLFPVWWALAAVAIFFLLQPSSPETNALVAGTVAVTIASVWYLPHGIKFVKQILWLAWGVEDPRGRTVDLLSPSTYTAYLHSIVWAVSLVLLALLALAAVLHLVHWFRGRQRDGRFARGLNSNWWVVWVSVLVPYLILSTSIYKEDRAITPVLPFLGVILAAALLNLPWRRLRFILVAVTLGFGLVQFFAISFTEAHGLVEPTLFSEPVLGQTGLFTQGPYLELPDSGLNDPGYYIAGDVLTRVEATRQERGWDDISLGVLAGSSHVHVGMFVYEQLLRNLAIQLESPVQTYPAEAPYSMAFRYDYALVLKKGSRGKAMRQAANLILNERRVLFETAFALEKVYTLPDGDEAYLFCRRFRS
ncbi:MAG: glycosyltransferase family 39 protein, partial [Anaerolineae bacterium]